MKNKEEPKIDLDEWKSLAGFYKDPFIDSEWIDQSVYVLRPNGALLNEVSESTKNRESQIMLVRGPYGIGKGAFKHALETCLDQCTDIVINAFTVKQPNLTELQFYRAVGNAIGLEFGTYLRDRWEVRRKLEKKIIDETKNGFFLLIVDDAHYITPDALHAIKYITDIEQNNVKCCTALLLGTDAILETLKRKGLGQVVDRIHLRRSMKAFSQRDTLEYIARAIAFSRDEPLQLDYAFPDTPTEVQEEKSKLEPFEVLAGIRVYSLTSGIPRHVRLLCSEAIKMAAITADSRKGAEMLNIVPDTIQLAWDSLLGKGEIPS
jgi:type II secretory pathway predicted ATPase ExeA